MLDYSFHVIFLFCRCVTFRRFLALNATFPFRFKCSQITILRTVSESTKHGFECSTPSSQSWSQFTPDKTTLILKPLPSIESQKILRCLQLEIYLLSRSRKRLSLSFRRLARLDLRMSRCSDSFHPIWQTLRLFLLPSYSWSPQWTCPHGRLVVHLADGCFLVRRDLPRHNLDLVFCNRTDWQLILRALGELWFCIVLDCLADGV